MMNAALSQCEIFQQFSPGLNRVSVFITLTLILDNQQDLKNAEPIEVVGTFGAKMLSQAFCRFIGLTGAGGK